MKKNLIKNYRDQRKVKKMRYCEDCAFYLKSNKYHDRFQGSGIKWVEPEICMVHNEKKENYTTSILTKIAFKKYSITITT